MDAFEKCWAEYSRKDDIGSGFTYDEARKAGDAMFRAGMRAAALIVADHAPDTNPGSPCNMATAAILAEADK